MPAPRAIVTRLSLGLLGLLAVSGMVLPTVTAQSTPVAVTPAPTPVTNPSLLSVTHGVASGDVTASSAVIWARASGGPAQMHVRYGTDPTFAQSETIQTDPGAVTEATDFTAQISLADLAADTMYYYQVWFTATPDQAPPLAATVAGTFRTAPAADQSRPVSFIVGGDVGGQQYCRRIPDGYRIFAAMQALTPDFYIANGDLIYADGYCPVSGPGAPFTDWTNIPGDFPRINDPEVDWTNAALVREIYLRHWRYNRLDPSVQAFHASTPVYAQWDDHEVINDFGVPWEYQNSATQARPGFPNLVASGLNSFFWYYPIARNADEPDRIYRAFNYGQDLDLFIIDQRSYRSRNDIPDGPDKTLLGAAQLDWLKQGLLDSRATWKVISADCPLSVPTGSDDYGRDCWGADPSGEPDARNSGFAYELQDLLSFIDANDIENVAFVATDVHFALITKYEADVDGDGDLLSIHEIISGPLNAVRGTPPELDPTYNPTILYGEGDLFNFAYVRIVPGGDGTPHLIADIRDEHGMVRPGSQIDLAP